MINLCDRCFGTYEKCMNLDKPPQIKKEGDIVVECSMFFDRKGINGVCIDCESGGRVSE